MPITVADMRAELGRSGKGWVVHSSLKDADVLPRYKTGLLPNKMPLASQVARVDVRQLVEAMPTSNPFLMERRLQLGYTVKPVSRPASVPPAAAAGPGGGLVHESGEPVEQAVLSALRPVTVAAMETANEVHARSLQLRAVGLSPLAHPIELHVSAVAAAAPPSLVDWRSRYGWPWITSVQSQDCENCWAMSGTALIEAMLRINHSYWSKRSEGDPHDAMGYKCEDGGWPQALLDRVKQDGIDDPIGYPHQSHLPYQPSADRAGRIVKIGDHSELSSIEDQKHWLDVVGPLTVAFQVWDDFYAYGGAVYRKHDTINGKANAFVGLHAVLCVGYDDTQGCWICKNSWGTGFGEQGYFKIAYGEVEIDNFVKVGLQVATNPDPVTKRRLHAGGMIESGNGDLHRNLELFSFGAGGQVRHHFRDGSSFAWSFVRAFGDGVRSYPSVTASTWDRNFELVFLTNAGRLHHWAFNQSPGAWWDGGVFGPADAAGMPSIIQGNYGKPAPLEVAVMTADGAIDHWFGGGGHWTHGVRFGSNVAATGTLFQSGRFNRAFDLDHDVPEDKGNLELVCTLKDGRMQHWVRDDAHGFVWQAKEIFGGNVAAVGPRVIEGPFGQDDETKRGHLELCVAAGGQVQHWWYDTVNGTGWHYNLSFGHDVWNVLSFVKGSYGFDFEVVVIRTDNQLQHYWSNGQWHEGVVIAGPTS